MATPHYTMLVIVRFILSLEYTIVAAIMLIIPDVFVIVYLRKKIHYNRLTTIVLQIYKNKKIILMVE